MNRPTMSNTCLYTEKNCILGPAPLAVFQRGGFTLLEDERGGPNARIPGAARITLHWTPANPVNGKAVFCFALYSMGLVVGTLERNKPFFEQCVAAVAEEADGRQVQVARLTMPAGGWYRMLVSVSGDGQNDSAVFGPFGVGETFIVAGQSYMGSYSDRPLTVSDEQNRVTCLDPTSGLWRVAHDPQPEWPAGSDNDARDVRDSLVERMLNYEGGMGLGSIWPLAMDIIRCAVGAPVGFMTVTRPGSTLAQWLPGSDSYARLAQARDMMGGCRAVLWGLGESDCATGTEPEAFEAGLGELIDAFNAPLDPKTPWLIARSTYHPASPAPRERHANLRAAQSRLIDRHPQAHPGPVTDRIGESERRSLTHSRHYTALGQTVAASLWAQAVLRFLEDHDR